MAAMGSALEESFRQVLRQDPMARFNLRRWIGVQQERIPPRLCCATLG